MCFKFTRYCATPPMVTGWRTFKLMKCRCNDCRLVWWSTVIYCLVRKLYENYIKSLNCYHESMNKCPISEKNRISRFFIHCIIQLLKYQKHFENWEGNSKIWCWNVENIDLRRGNFQERLTQLIFKITCLIATHTKWTKLSNRHTINPIMCIHLETPIFIGKLVPYISTFANEYSGFI